MSHGLSMALQAQGEGCCDDPVQLGQGREGMDSCTRLRQGPQGPDLGIGKGYPLCLFCVSPRPPSLSALCGFAFPGLGLVMFR